MPSHAYFFASTDVPDWNQPEDTDLPADAAARVERIYDALLDSLPDAAPNTPHDPERPYPYRGLITDALEIEIYWQYVHMRIGWRSVEEHEQLGLVDELRTMARALGVDDIGFDFFEHGCQGLGVRGNISLVPNVIAGESSMTVEERKEAKAAQEAELEEAGEQAGDDADDDCIAYADSPHPQIPDRPDLKQGGHGDERWIEIDFFWERYGVCMLLDQPERHSPYTRKLDLERDELLRSLGLHVVRYSAEDAKRDPLIFARLMQEIDRREADGELEREHRAPDAGYYLPRNPREPLINVTRTIRWLQGEEDADAVPANWPRHYDRDQVSWNFRPADGALV